MKFFTLIILTLTFLLSTSGFACSLESLDNHCEDVSYSSSSMDYAKVSKDRDSHYQHTSFEDCGCVCHGHTCKVLGQKVEARKNHIPLLLEVKSRYLISRDKLSNYHSDIIKPPIA